MKTIEIKWSTKDVLYRAESWGISLTEAQGDQILQDVFDNHDADIGVNWLVIDYHTENFLENLNQ